MLLHFTLIEQVPGRYGVTLFFLLSGFLITLLLLRERKITGGVSLRGFYIRRSLRIFPAFYVFWMVCAALGYREDAAWSFFYLEDYRCAFHDSGSLLPISWSLAIEEQFYLLWPALLIRIPPGKLVKILVLLIPCVQIYRLLWTMAGFQNYAHFAFETRMDALLAGCFIAFLASQRYPFPEWIFSGRTAAIAAAFLLAACALKYRGQLLIGFAAVTYAGGLLLMRAVACPPRWLNHAAARHVGRISYSLYLYHTLSAALIGRWPQIRAYNGVATWIAGSFLLAEMSYWGVERLANRISLRLRGLA